ncbi:hypothetical protein NDA11_002970 [Ustilago hordei]|uniref:Tubulin-specific chaperone A n=1 Tax=Ustilago hordei TaxID=120017 RepID=I2G5N3_USTHO|nr:hypothetical protein NDA10_001206 [Ustilago hordei]KAJ1586147.1 hypothetical protein NDA12_005330 [Ustilago hordei]KAJ1589335.1 hypothetical protein NDA15_004529 [Ustilago hordei]KAJ1590817.1 hypothetical protein NDA11_002970 [Ustilago hordei]KAJ1601184.1 hypothetical protein NDA14_007921 [Ustilago hordei]
MSFANASTTKRQLTIKTGEESSYLTEAKEQQARITSFIDAGRDEYDIKQQRKVLEDSLKMVPDCRKRLEIGVDDLRVHLEGLENDTEVNETEEFKAAKHILSEVESQLCSPLPSI